MKDLEDELGVTSTEVVSRIQDLEKRGRFTGIMLDNARGGGKSFVRVSLEDMRAIGSFVNSKGRLTVEEFTREANNVLQLSDPRQEEGEEWEGGQEQEEGSQGKGVDENISRPVTTPVSEGEIVAKTVGIGCEEDAERLDPPTGDKMPDLSTIVAASCIM